MAETFELAGSAIEAEGAVRRREAKVRTDDQSRPSLIFLIR
jgi:hypothetical protein